MRSEFTLSEYKARIEAWIYKHADIVFFDESEMLEIYLKLRGRENAS
jgi:hypothetical protein